MRGSVPPITRNMILMTLFSYAISYFDYPKYKQTISSITLGLK